MFSYSHRIYNTTFQKRRYPTKQRRLNIDITLERKHLLAALNRVSPAGLRWNQRTGIQIEVGEQALTMTILNETGILRQSVPCEVSSSGSLVTTHHALLKVAKRIRRETLRLYSDPGGHFLAGEEGELERIPFIPPQSLARFRGNWQEAQWNSRLRQHNPLIQETLRCSLPIPTLTEALQTALSSAREVWMFGPGSGSCILFHLADPAISIVGQDGTQFSAAHLSLPHDYAGPRDGPRHWRALDLLIPVPSLRTLLNAFPRPRKASNEMLQIEGTFYTVGETGSVCSGMLTFHSPTLMRELAVPLVDSLYIHYPSWDVLFSLLSENSWTARLEVPRRHLLHTLKQLDLNDVYWITLKLEPGPGRLMLSVPAADQQGQGRTEELVAMLAEGDECSVNVSQWSLMGMLEAFKTDTVMIEYLSPRHPVKLRSGRSGKSGEVTQVHALGAWHPAH
jgi:hypothetical protein